MHDISREEIHGNCKNWIKDHDGPFAEDLGMFKPHLATFFKNGNAVRGYVKNIVSKVETILHNHQQRG
jgi:hypothetical protein